MYIKKSANPKGYRKEKKIKTTVFKAVYLVRWKKESETVIMKILKVCVEIGQFNH